MAALGSGSRRMDVRQQQLASVEQEVILQSLAQAVARPGCKFLEVGSWCGHSAIILGKVAQAFGGHLFCVDWWKGTACTELADIASRHDIFSLFWQRICSERLQDVVVPMRGPSELVAQILKPGSLQFIFLDADHSLQHVTRDIRGYAPLVNRNGGILCGHDCEGRISDYEPDFLEAGKEVDYHESVHCGVVCAVGRAFPQCAVNHSIWSVRAANSNGWHATDLTFPGITDRRQAPPPPIGATASHNFVRYGRRVYAAPHSWADFDVTDARHREHPEIASAPTLRQAKDLIRAQSYPPLVPILVEAGYLGFNIVAYRGSFYSMAQDLGPVDLCQLTTLELADLEQRGKCFCAHSRRAARLQVAVSVLSLSTNRKHVFVRALKKLRLFTTVNASLNRVTA
jgi:predicted O-methyltransferase YrrM